MTIRKLCYVSIMGLLTVPAWAQSWTFGPRLDLQLSATNRFNELQIGDYRLSTFGSRGNGEAVGGFARYDRQRWYAQAEYLRSSFRVSLYRESPSIGGSAGGGREARRQDVRLLAGVKPLPWLRLGGGFTYARYNWNPSEDNRIYESIRQRLLTEQNPILIEDMQKRLPFYNIGRQIDEGYRRSNVEGSLGIGADIGGFTLDLTYSRSLTPLLDGVTVDGAAYPIRYDYSYTTLRFGYRLLPLKAHLLAPRKSNRAYERIKQQIPFYRNEFHAGVGLLGDDIGSAFIYENRYTRYLSRRVGLTAGANMMRLFENFDTGFLPKLSTTFMLTAGVRVLPLYSRRHTVGLTTGPLLQYETGVGVSSGGTRTVNGQLLNTINLRADSDRTGLTTGWHSSLDYQFAATDRLLVGPWLRVFGQSFIVPDYASAGIQTSYRF